MPNPILGDLTGGDLFKVIFFQRMFGQRIMNVLHYHCTAAPSPALDRFEACISIANTLTDTVSLLTDMRELQSHVLTHTSIRVQYIKETTNTYPFYEQLINLPGTRSADANLCNVALSIEKRAEFNPAHPRQGIGRLQLAGVPDNTFSSGLFSSAYLDDTNALTTDLLNELTVGTGGVVVPCIVHKTAGQWVENNLFGTLARPEIRDMRRRTVGVGE